MWIGADQFLQSGWGDIDQYRALDETTAISAILSYLDWSEADIAATEALACDLVKVVRQQDEAIGGVDALMNLYDLTTEEGVLLMCLAEALLRTPDKDTEELLIKDKLTSANWKKYVGLSESSFVNMTTWGLVLSGRILNASDRPGYFQRVWAGLVKRSSAPVIRRAIRQAMKVLGEQFIIGRTIEEAYHHSEPYVKKGYSFSYDMLGEVALTQKDADRYTASYEAAIRYLGEKPHHDDQRSPGISIKLSALHPRYQFMQKQRVVPELIARLKPLMLLAQSFNLSIAVDAEEADYLAMSLDIFEALYRDPDLASWNGLSLVIQGYQRRAFYLIDKVADMAQSVGKRLPVRLVKGAYWDTEIKLAQVEGLESYPVFTRKNNTDVSYMACAKKLLHYGEWLYPQFATHNAFTVAAIQYIAKDTGVDYEFQNLHGMGKNLHNYIVSPDGLGVPSRVYAPIGAHEDLLPYLVRRLLENGANTSFVNRIVDESVPVEQLATHPIRAVMAQTSAAHTKIPSPYHLYAPQRMNSKGIDLTCYPALSTLQEGCRIADNKTYQASWWKQKGAAKQPVVSPTSLDHTVGHVQDTTAEQVVEAVSLSRQAFSTQWRTTPLKDRVKLLNRVADLLEAYINELIVLAVREAGKTIVDAVAEVREAVDFCRYYAVQAKKSLKTIVLPGPTGEHNELQMEGRGVFVCISPWNFPAAIFTGQVAAALVAGNTVLAKPAEQTPLIAARIVELFYEAGCPRDVLQLVPGTGSVAGAALVSHPEIAGVMFTGSTQTAKIIQRTLSDKEGPIVPLVAETGGMNAMLCDSTALAEQLVKDIIMSAFGSAGQRCSALRLLLLQKDIADHVLGMLSGAMQELVVGDPRLLSTDLGPVIDRGAQEMLEAHIAQMKEQAQFLAQAPAPDASLTGTFVVPQAFVIDDLSILKKEVFGPILHIYIYNSSDRSSVIQRVNEYGYGLTFGVHTRIATTAEQLSSDICAGNVYINRNMVGAVVGVQPFGGCGLSGTGPKAGGPHYLARLATEKTISIDTTAVGGNASLMVLDE